MAVVLVCFSFPGIVVVAATQELDIRTNFKDISRFAEFDHIETGFALTGSHNRLDCIKCHSSGQNEKLPHQCTACHDNKRATGMPKNHIATREPCDICHTTNGFIEQIDMDHKNSSAPCVFCHDGYAQIGKGVAHIQSSNNCKICHAVQHWRPLGHVKHNEISVTECVICHNNTVTRGKNSSRHISVSDNCGACHDSHHSAWRVYQMDHNEVKGDCQTCHNDVKATGMGATHIPVNLGCDSCHGLLTWHGVKFDHSQTGGLRCVRCHDTVIVAGKPPNHVISSDECQNCHDADSVWGMIRQFDHGDVSGPCRQCHQLPLNHVATQDECDICHQTAAWSLVYVRHLSLQNSVCRDCHNNHIARGVSSTHCPVSEDCSSCHSVRNWNSQKICQNNSSDSHRPHRPTKE